MQNFQMSLDGTWDFVHRSDDRAPPAEPRPIVVPGPWQAQYQDLRMKAGIGLYRRLIDLPDEMLAGGRIYIHFGAVFHHATVWINGERVGAHEGGFLNFSFDVTVYLHAGSNEVAVRAETPFDDIAIFPDAPFAEIPFGKQSWYGPLSGIWQSVYLERRNADHIERLRVQADLNGRIAVAACFRAPLSRSASLAIEVIDPAGDVVARADLPASEGDFQVDVAIDVPAVRPWSPNAPNLYGIRGSLRDGADVTDSLTETFGFRSFEARDGAFFLNGERFYLRGALDQDYYQETICSLPSVALLEDQFVKAKQLGLNCLRLHIKAPDPRYYEVADRLGMLIWTELPNGGLSTERSRKRKERLLKGIVDRDGNHPSVVIWTIINENWGVDLVHDGDHRAWLKRTYAWLKSYDPSRLVVDNSPVAPSFHVETDVADYHFYAAIPDHRADWDNFVARLAEGMAWQFSPAGDAVMSGKEPRLCSEFGNWGLPNPDDLKDADGGEPWWFESGHDWGEGVMYPHGIERRFTDWSLDRVFGSLTSFVEAAQWQQFRALKYQIEAMRRRRELAGYVITELTDVHWESNGLLDMRRNPRVFHDTFKTINADTVIIPVCGRTAFWAGEAMRIDLSVAHGGPRDFEGGMLTIGFGGVQTIPVPPIRSGDVARLGSVDLPADCTGAGSLQHVSLDLVGADGVPVTANAMDIAVYRHPEVQSGSGLALWSADADVRARLTALGYRSAFGLDDADIVVAALINDQTAAYVRQGGKVLLLPEKEQVLQPFFPHWQNVRVQDRQETLWQGDWASSFSWLRRSGSFAGFPGGPLLDDGFDRVIPNYVITGCNLLDFHARVHAGMVVGWVHRPAAIVVEKGYGKGRLVTSTFRLFRDPAGADPTATMLLHGLVAVTQGQAKPKHASETPALQAVTAG